MTGISFHGTPERLSIPSKVLKLAFQLRMLTIKKSNPYMRLGCMCLYVPVCRLGCCRRQ